AVEAVILAINALGAGLLLFVSGVVQRTMNDMDELEFKAFAQTLVRNATSDPFAATIATIPIFAVIFYFVMYGFDHWWFTAGIIIWMIASSITKITNLPVYAWIKDPKNTDPEELRKKRRTLQLGNNWRAWLTLLSVVVMACQFSIDGTTIAVASCVVITAPSLWLARKYFRN
ncbi:MAG: hypothetical protein ACREDA_04515, partial [Methylocella sp.]